MSFLEALGKLCSAISPKINIKNLNIKIIKNDNRKGIEYNVSSNNLDINPPKLEQREKERLKKLFSLALEEDYIFLKSDSKTTIEDFKTKDISSDTQQVLQFLRPKIPPEDLNIWRAALYLKSYFKPSEKEKTKLLKYEIMQRYGDKGKNIANLCTAGYFEDVLKPLYKSLMDNCEDEEVAKGRFKKIYERIVNELPFTVFVSQHMKVEEIKSQVLIKRQYGIKYINIHGIGKDNIRKIKEVIAYLEDCEEYKIKKEIREESNIIFVRIYFIEIS